MIDACLLGSKVRDIFRVTDQHLRLLLIFMQLAITEVVRAEIDS